jgi:hypothetical protein
LDFFHGGDAQEQGRARQRTSNNDNYLIVQISDDKGSATCEPAILNQLRASAQTLSTTAQGCDNSGKMLSQATLYWIE